MKNANKAQTQTNTNKQTNKQTMTTKDAIFNIIQTDKVPYWVLFLRTGVSNSPAGSYNLENVIEEAEEADKIQYMKFDIDSMRELTLLEYKIEKKVEDDLIQSGFKIKRRIMIPKHLEQLIGPAKIE